MSHPAITEIENLMDCFDFEQKVKAKVMNLKFHVNVLKSHVECNGADKTALGYLWLLHDAVNFSGAMADRFMMVEDTVYNANVKVGAHELADRMSELPSKLIKDFNKIEDQLDNILAIADKYIQLHAPNMKLYENDRQELLQSVSKFM